MLINLTQSVPLKELCRISAIGFREDVAKQIEFTLSHEAMIGFATELLWMYEDMNDSKKQIISTHQLRIDPAPTQAIGFYLTPDSPVLVLKVNSLTEKKEEGYIYEDWMEIDIRVKNRNIYYNIKNPSVEDIELITVEPYELSRKNIVDVKVFDAAGKNITNGYHTVTLEMNREGIKDFATMLLVWADNYKEGREYELEHIGKSEQGYNLGVILTRDSLLGRFKAHDLGVANDYDSRF